MPDNKNIKGTADRNRMPGNENDEVKYLARELGVSQEAVAGAIRVVGNDREKIVNYIRGNR